jgi:amino acid transporter
VVSTIVLVGIYVLVAVAAVAFAGPAALTESGDDVLAGLGQSVFGSPLGKLMTVVVLISALASAQTTILPTARMAVSMASAGAIPKRFGEINPRFRSPGFATVAMGVISIVWYVILSGTSSHVLDDSVLALGLIIAFYYGLTAIACVVFYRRELFKSARNFCFLGVFPGAGGLAMFALFIKTCFDLGKKSAGSTDVFGIGRPLVIGVGGLLAGVLLMAFARRCLPDFFKRRPEVAAPGYRS